MKAEKDDKKEDKSDDALEDDNDELESVKKEGGQRANSNQSDQESESSIDKKDSDGKDACSDSDEHCTSQSSSDSHECQDDFHKELKAQHLQDKFFNRFYYKVDPVEEFTDDIQIADLEKISDDELTQNREDILKERNKKKA